MGHIDKHISKSSRDLAIRMMDEWKLFSGTLNDNAEHYINKTLRKMNFNFSERETIILKFNKVMGYGYNRMFQKIVSNYVKIVLTGNNKEYEIITAYPDLEKGILQEEYFDFDNNDILNCGNDDLYKLFLNLYSLHKYEIRFLNNKNAYIKFSANDYFVKIKKDKIIVADNFKKVEQVYNYNNLDTVCIILDSVKNFVPKYSLFGSKNIFDKIDEQLCKKINC